MSNVNETRLYQFLTNYSGDWMKDADTNNDGQIIKAEFVNFLDEYIDEWSGISKTTQNDMINKFWKKFDTNTSDAYIGGTNIKDKNALSTKELDKLNEKLDDYKTFNEWIEDNLDFDSVGLSEYRKNWKQDTLDRIGREFEKFLASNENVSDDDIADFLADCAPEIQKEEFVDYYTLELLETYKSAFSNLEGYDITQDGDLLNLIKKYNFYIFILSIFIVIWCVIRLKLFIYLKNCFIKKLIKT